MHHAGFDAQLVRGVERENTLGDIGETDGDCVTFFQSQLLKGIGALIDFLHHFGEGEFGPHEVNRLVFGKFARRLIQGLIQRLGLGLGAVGQAEPVVLRQPRAVASVQRRLNIQLLIRHIYFSTFMFKF